MPDVGPQSDRLSRPQARQEARRELVQSVQEGMTAREAQRRCPVWMHRTTVYRLLKRVKCAGEHTFVENRHGQPPGVGSAGAHARARSAWLVCLHPVWRWHARGIFFRHQPQAGSAANAYRRPFREPGEGRRPTLTWSRQLPIAGEPADVVEIVRSYAAWLATSSVPKLFINAEPGDILVGRPREFCRSWPNQTEVTVRGSHFVQEDSPHEIGRALADWLSMLS